MTLFCQVSLGELVDKITILEIKKLKIKDLSKLKFVAQELEQLLKLLSNQNFYQQQDFLVSKSQLSKVNLELWEIEDKIRLKEEQNSFDEDFILLARSVYQKNDLRFKIKNEINQTYHSAIREVKSYHKY